MNHIPSDISWLLDSSVPTIRYKTLKYLSGLSDEDPILQKEYQNIQTSSFVQHILDQQTVPGQWPYINHYYTPKYTSTHWSLMLLEELLVDPTEPRFQKAVDYMLIATASEIQKRLETKNPGFTCLWGNIIRYAIYAGFLKDPRLMNMIKLVCESLFKNECKCDINGDQPCSWGLIRSLWGLASIPAEYRTNAIDQAVETGLSFLLEKHTLLLADYPMVEGGKVHPLWSKLSFPLFYQSDILFVLRILSDLNQLKHPKSQPAIDWLLSKRLNNGRFNGSNPFHQRTWPVIFDREDNNRWVTLFAMDVLQKAGVIL